jgi:hypothetical protein
MGNPMGMPSSSRMAAGASLSQSKLLEAAAAAAGMGETSSSSTNLFTELLPAGCAPDAYKLFVGNVPKSFTEEELRPVGALLADSADASLPLCMPQHVSWVLVVSLAPGEAHSLSSAMHGLRCICAQLAACGIVERGTWPAQTSSWVVLMHT